MQADRGSTPWILAVDIPPSREVIVVGNKVMRREGNFNIQLTGAPLVDFHSAMRQSVSHRYGGETVPVEGATIRRFLDPIKLRKYEYDLWSTTGGKFNMSVLCLLQLCI